MFYMYIKLYLYIMYKCIYVIYNYMRLSTGMINAKSVVFLALSIFCTINDGQISDC